MLGAIIKSIKKLMEKPEQKKDKMVKPVKAVRSFNFPKYDLTIQASSLKEAQKEIKKHLDSNTKKND